MAVNDGKIYITISDKRYGRNTSESVELVNKPNLQNFSGGEKESKDNIIGRYAEHQMFHLVKGQAVRFVNFATSNIGNLTGDYLAQKKVNEVKQTVSAVMGIGVATIAGAKVAGGWGAAIGFAVGAASILSNQVYSDVENWRNVNRTNLEINQLRDRAGLNALLDGSRGTEN